MLHKIKLHLLKGESMQMRKFISFDFWQKLGKALLVVVAVMPAAGIMISLGKVIAMSTEDITLILTIGAVMDDNGWAYIINLLVLYAEACCCSIENIQ